MDEGYDAVEGDRWTGWIVFAGIMMMIAGAFQAIYGLIAIVNDEWVVWGNRGAAYLDLTQWGWIHLIWGVIVVLSGIGVLSGNVLARAVGVVVAAISAIVNFLFIPVYPLWSVTVVVLAIVVIWALIAHGGQMRRA
jgi:hypothetical protein